MSRRPREINIYSIAEEAGVSPATVSRVINRRLGVGEETRRKICEILRRYDFVPDYPVLRSPKILVVAPWEDLTSYIQKALKGVYSFARANGMAVNLAIYDASAKESLLSVAREQQCAGVIALLPEFYMKALDAFEGSDLPLVFLDTSTTSESFGFIDNDSYSGSCEAARHLLSLGHRKIGYLRYASDSLNQLQRFKGYENCLKAEGIEIKPEWIVRHSSSHVPMIRGMAGLEGMRLLLAAAPEISAVMAVDDAMALGALSTIQEAGLRVPDDISVVGFDNYPETEVWHPALTTINHPIEEAGRLAAASILSGIRGGAWTAPREILPTSLVVRRSTGPARKA